jgi:NAD(P)-dependent dehydrogenase (short-subunit alcohol dehydrogenase family)
MWRAVAAKNPIRRRGYPEDIAKAIAFLASQDSSFITGVNIKVDGGFLDSSSLIWN